MASATMKAIAVYPGKAGSMHLRDAPRPRLKDVPNDAGVLVQVIRVGVDGTDKEIAEAVYGKAPDGEDHLIVGHESLGRVIEVGRHVPSSLAPGSLVVATVRRPGGSIYDLIGMQDMTTDEHYLERGIYRMHGYLAESYVEDARYVVPLPESLEPVGVLLEPLSVVEKGIRQAFEIQRRLRVWQPARAAVFGAGTVGPPGRARTPPARTRGRGLLPPPGAVSQQRAPRRDRCVVRQLDRNDRRRPGREVRSV